MFTYDTHTHIKKSIYPLFVHHMANLPYASFTLIEHRSHCDSCVGRAAARRNLAMALQLWNPFPAPKRPKRQKPMEFFAGLKKSSSMDSKFPMDGGLREFRYMHKPFTFVNLLLEGILHTDYFWMIVTSQTRIGR